MTPEQQAELAVSVAEYVDHAVIQFAETGKGDVERTPPCYRLRVGVSRVRFTVDREASTMNVLFLYRAP